MTTGSEILVAVKGLKEPQRVDRLTEALRKLDPTALVQVDMKQGLIDVVSTLPKVAVLMAIKEQGFKTEH